MSNNNLYTTVTAGKFKGKKLELPSLLTTRSTKSILKESFFNTVQFEIIDKIFIEVFGGSGSIGIEALSRGAKQAYFIEKDNLAFRILQKNCQFLEQGTYKCIFGDSFEVLPKIVNDLNEPLYLYFDPPFFIRNGNEDIYEKTLNLIEKLENKKIVILVLEHLSSWQCPSYLGKFNLIKTKKFGKSSLSYLK